MTLSEIILLLELCLQLVDRNYTKGDTIRFDIQRLRDKLIHESGGKYVRYTNVEIQELSKVQGGYAG